MATRAGHDERAPLAQGGALGDALLGGAALRVLVALGAAFATFRFVHDDFGSTLRAREGQLLRDHELRVLGVELPFLLVRWLDDGPWPHLVMNAVGAALFAWAGAATLRGLGCARGVALTASLLTLGTGSACALLRWASGLQQALALALGLGAFACALGPGWARILAAVALFTAGLFTKYLTLVSTLPWYFVAALFLGGGSRPRRSRLVFVGALLGWVAAGAAIAAGTIPGFGRFGGGRLWTNTGLALSTWVREGLYPALLVLALHVAERRAARADGSTVAGARRHDDPEPTGARRRRSMLAALAALAVAPWLFNGLYFADYYLVPALLFGAALLVELAPRRGTWWAARALAPGRWGRGARGGVAAAVALGLLPYPALTQTLRDTEFNRVERWLRELRASVDGARAGAQTRFVPSCGGAYDRASAEELAAYLVVADASDGVSWALGRRTTVSVAGSDEPGSPGGDLLVLGYCRDAVPRFRVDVPAQ
ncbi:MAG: hypothetical protein IT376_00070 [Polyangiaceae bacterium]|nr:hypothetical protein [Polyangiaceae bacterium]